MHRKDFDKWNKEKKNINNKNKELLVFCNTREIWWCSLGVNIGTETDGKNDNFERPVLILKVYNRESILIIPITSKKKEDNFHYELNLIEKKDDKIFNKKVWIKLTQMKVIDSRRLLRKVDRVSKIEFKNIKSKVKELI